MASILKREFAPISEQAWQEMDELAGMILKGQLSGRKVVDFRGPLGWEFAALNGGRLKVADKAGPDGVGWGTREVIPVIEMRIPFLVRQMELDSISRGTKDADLSLLQEAALKAARFEENVIYHGLEGTEMKGLIGSSEHKAVSLGADAEKYPAALAEALKAIALAGIGGPFSLVLGPEEYFKLLQSAKTGFPPKRMIADLLGGGEILMSPVLKGGVVLSTRSGDFELAIGKDFSLGYASHDRDSIELFITESLAFRVLEPQAIVPLKAGG